VSTETEFRARFVRKSLPDERVSMVERSRKRRPSRAFRGTPQICCRSSRWRFAPCSKGRLPSAVSVGDRACRPRSRDHRGSGTRWWTSFPKRSMQAGERSAPFVPARLVLPVSLARPSHNHEKATAGAVDRTMKPGLQPTLRLSFKNEDTATVASLALKHRRLLAGNELSNPRSARLIAKIAEGSKLWLRVVHTGRQNRTRSLRRR
jgi:hypothetical protein